jgi:hypothetical protein
MVAVNNIPQAPRPLGYDGEVATIQMGLAGLQTDLPSTNTLASKLRSTKNCTVFNALLEKDFGSRRWNTSPLANGIASFIDWWPDSGTQRVIACDKQGLLYKFNYPYQSVQMTPFASTDPANLGAYQYINFLTCGAEGVALPRKVFVFSGTKAVQVISADGTAYKTISKPPADWKDNNQPIKGIVHRSRVVAFGNENSKHSLYLSLASDHEDFTSAGAFQFPVYPGESEGIMDIFVYKSLLWILKYPAGLYLLDDSDSNVANWTCSRINSSFGGGSPNCTQEVLDDIFIANNYGGLTSLKTINTIGDLQSSDIYYQLGIERAVRENLSPYGHRERNVLYYAAKKTLFISYKSNGGIKNDRIVNVPVTREGPEATIIDKDQPNHLASLKDNFGVLRPHYCSDDGYIYSMDQIDRNVGGSAFTGEFWSQWLDFGQGNILQAETVKQFDFLEIVYLPAGDWNMTFEVWIDGAFYKTYQVKMDGRSELDEMLTDVGGTEAECPMSHRFNIGGQGRRIAIRGYNSGNGENFRITKVNIYFKYTSTHQIAVTKT